MDTRLDEIGDGIFRISTFVPDLGPEGFTFNQFLVRAQEPLLFHCGMRALFPAVRPAIERVLPVSSLRWISFGHVEADELGAMNHWLAAAPQAEVVHGRVGCDVSLNDLADRAPRVLEDDQVLELGDRRVRLLATPHLPHCWEAIVLFEETTRTLLCGDILTSLGDGPALSPGDPVERALISDATFPTVLALTPETAPALRRLAALNPSLLAVMHGPSYAGDGARTLRGLAEAYERALLQRVGDLTGDALERLRGTTGEEPELHV